jgi:hypothetical protein
MSWDPNASRTRYPGKLELLLSGRKPALAGFAIQPNGSMSSEYPLTGPAIGTHFACFYPPEAAARARSELELKIAAAIFEARRTAGRRRAGRTRPARQRDSEAIHDERAVQPLILVSSHGAVRGISLQLSVTHVCSK